MDGLANEKPKELRHANKELKKEQNLEILNAFDRIQIEYIDGTLMVK